MKNLGQALKALSLPSLIDRLKHGEVPNKKELELLNLLERTLVDSHKLEFGDKRVIELNVTVSDIRRQMMSESLIREIDKKGYQSDANRRYRQKVIDAEVENELRQNTDSSGSGEDNSRQDGSDNRNTENVEEKQESS